MEKLDAIVAGAGAVILVVAVVGAAWSGGRATSPFALSFPTHTHEEKLALVAGPGQTRSNATFTMNETNVVSVRVSVTLSAAVFPPQTSAHLKVQPPGAAAIEKDGAPGPAASSFTLVVDVPLAEAPAERSVDGSDAADAQLAGWADNSTLGMGDWLVELSYAPGPVAPPAVSVNATFAWTAWTVEAAPALPVTR